MLTLTANIFSAATTRTNIHNKTDSTSHLSVYPGNTKGGSITVPLTSCLTGLDLSVLQIKKKNVSCHKADSKTVKQEVNGTAILPPCLSNEMSMIATKKHYFAKLTGIP